MTRPAVAYERIERGIQKVIRTYVDGRTTEAYRMKYADEQGNIVSKTVRTEAQARTALARARTEVTDGSHTPANKGRTRFKDVADNWLKGQAHMKARTEHSCRWTIEVKLAPLHDVQMRNLTYAKVKDFRTQMDLDGLAPSSQTRTMWVLKAICEDARKRKLIAVNPCADLPKIKARRRSITIPSQQDVEALITRLSSPTTHDPKSWHDVRWPLIVEAAAYAGLRAGELAGLRISDFNAAKRSVNVERTIVDVAGELRLDTPKSDRGTRVVSDLDPGLCQRLSERCANQSARDYVFGDHSPDGRPRPLNHGNFYRRVFKPACAELGIEMRFHDLRHFHASLLIDAGLSPVEVAHRLGHANASFTLDTYSHLFKQESNGLGDLIAAGRREARGEEPETNLRFIPTAKAG
jgi:integrase